LEERKVLREPFNYHSYHHGWLSHQETLSEAQAAPGITATTSGSGGITSREGLEAAIIETRIKFHDAIKHKDYPTAQSLREEYKGLEEKRADFPTSQEVSISLLSLISKNQQVEYKEYTCPGRLT